LHHIRIIRQPQGETATSSFGGGAYFVPRSIEDCPHVHVWLSYCYPLVQWIDAIAKLSARTSSVRCSSSGSLMTEQQ
ncbi:hypothetical protein, partial [Paenibacillus sp. FSL H7-0331]|uniref:hypothetical protein n=1 Tax=Paenibacillus sp. FSL H7-0331 TaxID=1920421 RepID=UPI001C4C2FAB